MIGWLHRKLYWNMEIIPQVTGSEGEPVELKRSVYRPGVAQRVGRGIALLFHDRGTRRGWVVSSTPRQHFTPGKDPVPVLQEAGWALGPVWTGGNSRPHRNSIPDRPVRSSVAVPTELPGPQNYKYKQYIVKHNSINDFIKVCFLHHLVQRHVSTLVMSHLQVDYIS